MTTQDKIWQLENAIEFQKDNPATVTTFEPKYSFIFKLTNNNTLADNVVPVDSLDEAKEIVSAFSDNPVIDDVSENKIQPLYLQLNLIVVR